MRCPRATVHSPGGYHVAWNDSVSKAAAAVDNADLRHDNGPHKPQRNLEGSFCSDATPLLTGLVVPADSHSVRGCQAGIDKVINTGQ